MHGLINRSFEVFLRGTYGNEFWREIVGELGLGFESFEPMFHYEASMSLEMVETAARKLGKSHETLLEDYGTFLIVDPRSSRVRRLLRFGGVNYTEFLNSLEDLPGRARLAVAELDMPEIEVDELSEGSYQVMIRHPVPGFGHVILGALRALADDYGALALLDHNGRTGETEELMVYLLDVAHAEGRKFDLAAGAE
ncbi:heme NO-binding domain-containing protein [Aliiroseovarius crassostreae]|uniref:Heme NO-binding domain-containing protein n=1 Tax=Aliiroseovarius crassostreae TaxID=154981 RepID=A0A9Q9H7T1_9RHOB|nr:heme NO-binding domain-containing protein [Aliiroseovarius crassostreae]UWP94266.1 heme NO-binding domain-containing protein [Aliiroseovarius crassostreae]UWQ06335.1 heme NO-binding domain-containing protein [Aliiroseovarius crassostreae]